MAYKVRAELYHALALLTHRGKLFVSNDKTVMAKLIGEILIEEKGYPTDTVVEIDGSDPMDMVLVVEDNGSWELV
ncbi:hypothetical protein D3C87_839050 [compost metagenome]